MRRPTLLLAALLAASVASPAAAGGWASVTPDDPGLEPTAGKIVEIGFVVLQHGVTPRDDLLPQLIATNQVTGVAMTVAATADGGGGHYTAPVVFDDPGYWTWRVDLKELESELDGVGALTVRATDGTLPELDFATIAGMLGSRDAVREQTAAQYEGRIGDLESRLDAALRRVELVERQLASLQQAAARTAARK